jgi:hypothetical protein
VKFPVPEPYVGCQIRSRRSSLLSVSMPIPTTTNEPGPLEYGYSGPLYAPPGGTPHPTYESTYPQSPVSPWGGISAGYDSSQRPSVDPSSCGSAEYVQLYSVQSTNEPAYPLGLRPQRSPGHIPEAWPPFQSPTDVQNASDSGPFLKVFLACFYTLSSN